MLKSSRQRLHQFETNKDWEQTFKTARNRSMMKWPSWDYLWNESYCNLEGAFTTLAPYTWHEGEQRCVSYEELEQMIFDQNQLIEEERLAAEEELKRVEEERLAEVEELRREEEERLAEEERRLREEEHLRETA